MGFLNPVDVRLVRGMNTDADEEGGEMKLDFVSDAEDLRRTEVVFGIERGLVSTSSRVSLDVEARSDEAVLALSPRIGGSWLPGSENIVL